LSRVGAELAAFEFVVAIGQRGEKHKRHIRKARRQRGQPFQKLEAGHRRHADVGEHEVGHHAQDRGKPFATVMGNGHGIAAIKQFLGD
jgi:hypothetical protein